jgi:uncharacterized protein (DUF305 family)
MTAIFTAVLPIVVKIVLWYLDLIKANNKAKEKFLEFLKEMEPHHESCLRLRKSYMAQRQAILEKRKEKNNGNN